MPPLPPPRTHRRHASGEVVACPSAAAARIPLIFASGSSLLWHGSVLHLSRCNRERVGFLAQGAVEGVILRLTPPAPALPKVVLDSSSVVHALQERHLFT